jgi:hypothetical protein
MTREPCKTLAKKIPTIQTGNLIPGIYFLKVSTDNVKMVQKIIVE